MAVRVGSGPVGRPLRLGVNMDVGGIDQGHEAAADPTLPTVTTNCGLCAARNRSLPGQSACVPPPPARPGPDRWVYAVETDHPHDSGGG